MSKRKITALYERLSRDDDQQGESNPIVAVLILSTATILP